MNLGCPLWIDWGDDVYASIMHSVFVYNIQYVVYENQFVFCALVEWTSKNENILIILAKCLLG